jgi:acyl carrier protein
MSLTADVLIDYLRDELNVDVRDIGTTSPLFSAGVIDSFALVKMIAYLEEACAFRVSAADVNLDNLDTIERILAYVERATA